MEPGRIGPTDGQRRDVVQRGLNGLERVGEASLAGSGSMPQSPEAFQRNHGVGPERADGGPPQRAHVAQRAEQAAHVAGDGAHIGALAAFGLEHRMVNVRQLDQVEAADLDRTGLELDGFAAAREVVRALPFDLDGGIARRHLGDGSGEPGQDREDVGFARARDAGLDHPPLGIVGVALLAPAHGEAVAFAPVHHERDRFGGFAERDRQASGCERVERPGMAGTARRGEPLDRRDRMGRRHADRLVEHDPAVNVELQSLALAGGLARPRLVNIRHRRLRQDRV